MVRKHTLCTATVIAAVAAGLVACSGGSSHSSGSLSAGVGSGVTTTPPAAGVTSLQVAGSPLVSGDVSAVYRITDPSSSPGTLEVSYSTNGGVTWTATTDGAGGAGRTGLASGPGLGIEHVYVWDSAVDVPTLQAAILRVGLVGGGSLETSLTVDNQPLSTLVQLTRRPYVQNTTHTSLVVAWHTDVPTDTVVEYGPTTALGNRKTGATGTIYHDVEITGLQPGQTYSYRIVANGQPLTLRKEFATAPLPNSGADITFLAFGDSGTGSQEQYDLARRMATETPDFLVHTGDLLYPRGGGFTNPVGEYNRLFFGAYEDTLDEAPMFPSAGNHDAGSAFIPFRDSFFLPDNGGAALTDELYYSFEWGDAKFLILETTALFKVPVGAHFTWLLNELRNNQHKWLIVVFHHTFYSAYNGGDTWLRRIYEPLFENYGVDLVIAGHDHNYERTIPIADYNTTPGYQGLTHVITGGGGAGLDTPTPVATTASLVSDWHYMKFRISGDWLFGEAINIQGQLLDSFAIQNQ